MNKNIEQWLFDYLDNVIGVECDGMTRLISMMFDREGIDYTIHRGAVISPGNKKLGVHYWIELDNGDICDLRCRMWFGEDAPHGIFNKEDTPFQYESVRTETFTHLTPTLFFILSGYPIDDIPSLHEYVREYESRSDSMSC